MSNKLRSLLALLFVFVMTSVCVAKIGDRLDDAKQTDFFKFFNLTEVESKKDEQKRTVTSFRPATGKFRELVRVDVTLNADNTILAMQVSLSRSFIDSKQNGIFARDFAKSMLRSSIPTEDAAEIKDLANEIEFPGEMEGYKIMRATPDPKLPGKPTDGYLTYQGKQKLYEASFTKSVLRIANSKEGDADVLLILVKAK